MATPGRRALLLVLERTHAKHVAARCKVTISAVYNWRTGYRRPSSKARRALFVNYGIALRAWEKR